MALKRNTKVDASMPMSSMTDIVFLLLIFFLVTSTLINPNALKLLLPKSTGQIGAKATVSVSIKDWGDDTYTYHINGDKNPATYEEVEDGLIEFLSAEEDPTFSIFSDQSVPVGEIVGIIAYFGYNWLTSKISDLVYEMESSTTQFIDIVLNEPGEEA